MKCKLLIQPHPQGADCTIKINYDLPACERRHKTQKIKQNEKTKKYPACAGTLLKKKKIKKKKIQNHTKEEERGCLPENIFRIMIVKMIQNLESKLELWIKRLEGQIEKMQEMFNKDVK